MVHLGAVQFKTGSHILKRGNKERALDCSIALRRCTLGLVSISVFRFGRVRSV